MKFDITRSMKDANYGVSEELEMLDEAALADVYGGDYPDVGVAGAAAASSSTSIRKSCCHSYSLLCDINIFSAEVNVLAIPRLLNIGVSETRICVHHC